MSVRIIKLLVSISLIGVLLWGVDWRDIAIHLKDLDPLLAIAAFILLSIQYPVSAWKWRKSLLLHGADQPVGRLLRILCIAFFFNNFLPTAIGGDAYRAYRTFDHTSRRAHAVSAVILERLLGIFALLFIGYLCALYLVLFGSLRHRDWVLASLIAIAIGVALLLVALRFRPAFVDRILEKVIHVPRLEPLFHSLRTVRANIQHLPGLVGLSLMFQLLAVFTISILFAAIGLHGAFAESGFTAAASGIASVLPISINGVGVMEGSFVVAALEANLPYSGGVIVALCLRGYMLLSSVAFGILYAFEPKDPVLAKQDGMN